MLAGLGRRRKKNRETEALAKELVHTQGSLAYDEARLLQRLAAAAGMLPEGDYRKGARPALGERL